MVQKNKKPRHKLLAKQSKTFNPAQATKSCDNNRKEKPTPMGNRVSGLKRKIKKRKEKESL